MIEFNLFVMSLGAQLIIGFLLCQLFLIKLKRKLFLSAGEGERSGRAGEVTGGQGLRLPSSEGRGSPMENPLHLKTSAAPFCSLSPGSRAAEPGHGTPQPAWHRGGEYGSRSLGQYSMVTIPDLLPSAFSSCTDTTTVIHISLCCLSPSFKLEKARV